MDEGSGQRGKNNNVHAASRAALGPSRIVVADDHLLFRSAIRHTLAAHPDLEVVAEAADGQEAAERCHRKRATFPPPHGKDGKRW